MNPSRPTSTSTRPAQSPLPRPHNQVNTQTKVLDTHHGRILCIADIRGRLSGLNDLAREVNAKAIIHTGDFGFFDQNSLERINDRTLRHLTMYSPLIPTAQRTHLLASESSPSAIRSTINISMLSEFPLLLSGQIKLQVPVYTVWGACEDVLILEKFRVGTYTVDNLHVLDEATTRCLDIGGVKLRLFGLGGAFVPHKMFDNGDGNATIAGGQGTMWTTALQIGELVDTAQRVYDASETRLLITHASPGRDGIMAQLALVLKADLTISASLHFRYATSYNEFSVNGDFDNFRHKLTSGKETFDRVWGSIRPQVDAVIDEHQRVLLDKALSVVERIPPPSNTPGNVSSGEEHAWKNCWNWNLCDAAFGSLVFDIKEGRISAELKSQGFNYAYRRTATGTATPNSVSGPLPPYSQPSTKVSTPIPDRVAPPKPEASTPPPVSSNGPGTPRDSPSAKMNGADKSKPRKDKKDTKKDRASHDGGASTPEVPPTSSTPALSEPPEGPRTETEDPKSPVDGSPGVRTPRGGKPQRNPWTIFLRVQIQVPLTEPEVRDFFNTAKDGITKVTVISTMPGRARIAYVEFGDEEAMKAGLAQHAPTLHDSTPEVKQATDRESRTDGGHHRGMGGRGRGRGSYAARNLAAAGLTRGHGAKGEGGD